MIPASIDGEEYPIVLDDSGNLQWQTIQVAQERDEVWDDWSLGLGETKQETGHGYFFATGWDASTRGALRLSPFYHNLNNTALTTAYGYTMEGVETSGSTLTLDAASTGKGSIADGSTLSFSHTVAVQSERILVVALNIDTRSSLSWNILFPTTYGGIPLTWLAAKKGDAGTNASVGFFFLLNPPTGANNIVITNNAGGTLAMVGGAESLYGVNQDDPFGSVVSATDQDGTPTVTVTTSAGEFVLAAVALDTNDTLTAGTNETERWDDNQGTTITGAGYTQAGSDGGVMAPSIDGAATDWVEIAVPIKPASTTSRSIMQIADTTKIFKYTSDSDTGLTLDATDTTASGVAGQPEKMNGNWYVPMGNGVSAQKITGVTVANVTGTWKADHLSTFQKGITPTLARVNSATQHQIDFNEDTGDITDTWSGGQKAGDSSTKITHLLEAQGQLFACKEDNLYEFGVEAESRPSNPFIQRGKIDSDNGKGSFAFGDEIIYMSKGDLWRKRIGGGALPIGLNTIRSWRKIDDIIDTPKDGRPAYGVHVGEYWYYLQNDGEVSHLIQARKRREGDPAGHELIQNSVLSIPLSLGLGVDSKNQLWIKGASTDETVRDARVIELADDGSLDVQNRRGQASADHDIWFDERNPGRPQDKVQIRHMTVELEGDWDATTSLQLKLYRDDATTPTSIGSAITSSGMTVRNPTVGTTDTAFRFRPQLTVTTNSSYTPKNSDPQVLRVIVGIRFPEIIRIVVNAEQLALDKTGLEAFEAEQNLRRLQNQGTVTFRRPGDYDDPSSGTDLVTDRTFTGEVESVTDIMYKTSEVDGVSSYAHGIELRVKRWITY
jgi:hypothetical protein